MKEINMGMEREFDDKALSRDRDPVVPRGAVVAGEDRELEVVGWQARAERLEALAKHLMVALAALDPDPDAVRENLDTKRLLEWAAEVESTCDLKESVYTYAVRILDSPRPDPETARERIRALEAEARRRWQELETRLEEIRPVVRAAIRWMSDNYRTTGYAADERVEIQRLDDISGGIIVLSTTTRAWAEGSGEEEG